MRSDERGTTLVEAMISVGLLLVVLVPAFSALTTAERTAQSSTNLDRAVSEARSALDGISRQVRAADGMWQGSSATEAIAWYDLDRDGSQDANEMVVYSVSTFRGEPSLLRTDAAGIQVMATGVRSGSALTVTTMTTGVLLHVALSVDVSPVSAPGPTLVETEVLARNA